MFSLLKIGSIMARIILAFSMILLAVLTILIIENIGIDPSYKKTLLDLGSESYPFTIQNIMWVFFFFGMGELLYRWIVARYTAYEIKKDILPEGDEVLLTTSDTRKLYEKVKKQVSLETVIPIFLKKLIDHFQTTHSIAQTQELFNTQMDIKYSKMNTDYSMIRYITWIIPTLGFIGTVTGISQALAYAAATDPTAKTFLGELTAKLGVAFDTTLVALLMSAFLVFLLHLVESYEEKSLAKLEEYILDNFITRLYIHQT